MVYEASRFTSCSGLKYATSGNTLVTLDVAEDDAFELRLPFDVLEEPLEDLASKSFSAAP